MIHSRHEDRQIRAPRGPQLNAKSWLTEAPLRMLMNNLDPEVAENPAELVVYGGIGRAARTWQDFDKIVATLKTLNDDETLLVQSGKPVGVFRTHADAPRVLIANSNLVPYWATWEHFHALDRKGLAVYGHMTAGSWIYIGTQGIVQGTYETFVEAGRQHYGGNLRGPLAAHRRPRRHGRAQPLAAVMAGACCLAVECNPASIDFRLRTRYLDARADTLDEALATIAGWTAAGQAKSVGLLGNAADVLPELVRRGVRPDLVTDQTSAHDPLNGYLPQGWTLAEWQEKRRSDPRSVEPAARASMRTHVEALLAFHRWACRRSTTATTSGRLPGTRAWRMLSRSRASCPPTSVRCSAGALVLPAGWRCPATRKTCTAPTPRSKNCCPTTATCTTGWTWRANASRSRDCRHASAGSDSATDTG